jgi:hypothetical protein
MVIINMTFFSRHGSFDRVPALSTALAATVLCVLVIGILAMCALICYMLLRPAGEAERARVDKAGGNLGTLAADSAEALSVTDPENAPWDAEADRDDASDSASDPSSSGSASTPRDGDDAADKDEGEAETRGFFDTIWGMFFTPADPEEEAADIADEPESIVLDSGTAADPAAPTAAAVGDAGQEIPDLENAGEPSAPLESDV